MHVRARASAHVFVIADVAIAQGEFYSGDLNKRTHCFVTLIAIVRLGLLTYTTDLDISEVNLQQRIAD